MHIRKCNKDDFTFILDLWKTNRDTLSIPFTRCIEEMCSSDYAFIGEVNDKPIAMCEFKYMSRLKEYRVEHICIDSAYRGHGYGTELIRYLYSIYKSKVKSMIIPCEFVAYARKGALNNAFYNKLSCSQTLCPRKNMDLIRYVFDERKIIDG